MRRIAAKFVPRLLNNDQRDHRVQVCTELQEAVRHDPNFLSRVITGDETWLYDYDLETKQQPLQWKTPSSPWPKKARQVRSNIKSILFIFLDIRGIVHKEFVPPGQTVNGKFYCKVLRRLRQNVRRKRPEMWKNGNWLLHHDNVSAHTSLVVREFLIKNNVSTVPHPAYSPGLAPCNFYVFPENETPVERVTFRLHWWGPSRIATDTKHANAGRLQWVLPKVAKSLGSLYTNPRWLLRRWW